MDASSQGTQVPASDTASPTALNESTAHVPYEPLGHLFLRFLKFGSLAWGGPVAQIAMIRHELVKEEKWVSPALQSGTGDVSGAARSRSP
jgi:chromate transporter